MWDVHEEDRYSQKTFTNMINMGFTLLGSDENTVDRVETYFQVKKLCRSQRSLKNVRQTFYRSMNELIIDWLKKVQLYTGLP